MIWAEFLIFVEILSINTGFSHKNSKYRYSGVQLYEVQARGLSPLLIKLWTYLTFMNTAILISLNHSILEKFDNINFF
jgi:hypothetical protein